MALLESELALVVAEKVAGPAELGFGLKRADLFLLFFCYQTPGRVGNWNWGRNEKLAGMPA